MAPLQNSTEVTRAAAFSDRGLIVHLNGGGWLNRMTVTGVLKTYQEDLPDHPILVTNPRLDDIPKLINIFLNVERRQRHGASDP